MGSGASDDQTLTLGLGLASSISPKSNPPASNLIIKAVHVPWDQADPSLTLSLELSGETYPMPHQELSATSSHSNSLAAPPNFVSVKREREAYVASDDEEEDGSPTATAAAATTTTTRKKLRLTKEQSALLEDSFKQHSTLNPQKQKQALADRLNLRPRQVEVWFQNRRARTKLKQTEMDCEQLKKCCETLTDENRRLQKELQELRALKLGQPNGNIYMHMAAAAPAATLTMCPSCCQRIGSAAGVPVPIPIAAATPTSNNPLSFTLGPGAGVGPSSKAHFYPSFPNPSAAC